MADPKSVMERWLEAIEGKDVGRITGLLADDLSMETEVLDTPIRGRKALHDLLVGTMDAYESIRIERRKLVASGRDVAALVGMRIRFGRDLDLLGETLSTAGKELHVVGALFAEVNEAGQIARLVRVRDNLGVIQQLGVSPERLQALVRKFHERTGEERSRVA